MAKYRPTQKQYDSGQTITTKSRYGSHADMVVELEELESIDFFGDRVIEDYEVVCKDDNGYYVTLKSRLDNRLADPNRYSSRRH